MEENEKRRGRKKSFDTRENQIKKLERNIRTSQLFLEFLKNNDIAKVNSIILLFDEEIKKSIRCHTSIRDEQNECYQFTAYTFMDMCSRNVVTTSNLGGYLCGIVRNYFLKKKAEKKQKREVEFNDWYGNSVNDYY
jgi:hypothetical protein